MTIRCAPRLRYWLVALLLCSPPPAFSHDTPERLGTRLIDELLARGEFMMYVTDRFTGIHYAEAAMGFGALRFAGATANKTLADRILARYRNVPGTDGLLEAGHVDANVYGILPLEIYRRTGDNAALQEGLALADAQWDRPLHNGMTRQSRYWIDDIWMVGALQVQAFRASGDAVYLDRAALQTAAYLDKLQQANGLFHHGPDAPFYWGRGNGWVAAGLAELLSELPEDHPFYEPIVTRYRRMMRALLDYQAGDGMWRQLVDRPEAWKETSATAMFGYAMAVGVQTGILPAADFQPAYENAWTALTGYLDADARLTEVCVGTGQSDDVNDYLNRPRAAGDLHGQAPLLWFAGRLVNRR